MSEPGQGCFPVPRLVDSFRKLVSSTGSNPGVLINGNGR